MQLKSLAKIKLFLPTAWLVFVFFHFLYKVEFENGNYAHKLNPIFFLSVVTSAILMMSFGLFIQSWSKKTRIFLGVLILSAYSGLCFYNYRVNQSLDFSIVADHKASAFGAGTFGPVLKLAGDIFQPPDLFWFCVGNIVFAVLLLKAPLFKSSLRVRSLTASLILAIFAGKVFLEKHGVDQFSLFARSAAMRLLPGQNQFAKFMPSQDSFFPLMREYAPPALGHEKPHVFLVFIESFNANVVEMKTPDGQEVTPFYNKLISKGVYFEQFYGQSVQTAKGHFSALCGLTPIVYGKGFEKFEDTNLNCIPRILQDNGYYTFFSKANPDIGFDNIHGFATKQGYDVMNSMTQSCDKEEKGACWGWGLQDRIFYQRIFKFLAEQNIGEKPVFATLATISSHMPFDEVPQEEKTLFPEATSRRENYMNAIHVTDKYLQTFMEEFEKSPYAKNSVVILTGDHSFPLGEHGNYFNEANAYEENFRTPMLVLDYRKEKKLQPHRVTEAYSQLNMPATLMYLTGISGKVHFRENSLFEAAPQYIPLVQPYAGTYFAVVKWPFKYVYYNTTKEEFYYNLLTDPLESTNLITNLVGEEKEQFHKQVAQIYWVADLLETDKIFPDNRSSASADE